MNRCTMLTLSKYLPVLAVVALCGCTVPPQESDLSPEPEEPAVYSAVPFTLPATFTGQIPCPDCLRVDITLNLRADSIYQLRKTYQAATGPVRTESQMRTWRYSPEGNFIVLGKQKGSLKTYVLVDDNRLRFSELESEHEGAGISYELNRKSEIDPFPDTVKIRGMFSVQDGAATLTECSSGNVFPVAVDGDYQTAVQAYANIPHSYGEPMLMSINGKLVQGDAGGEAPAEMISIDRFKRYYPNQDCEGNQIRASLTDTVWRLSEIDGEEVSIEEPDKAPYLILGLDRSLSGFGGCNQVTGTYLAKGDLFLVKREIQTRLACPWGVGIENAFISVLDQSETFDIEGTVLQLRDRDDRIRARLLANQ